MSYRRILENLRKEVGQETPVATQAPMAPRPSQVGLGARRQQAAQPEAGYEPMKFARNFFKSLQDSRSRFQESLDRSTREHEEAVSQPIPSFGGNDEPTPAQPTPETPSLTQPIPRMSGQVEQTTPEAPSISISDMGVPENELLAVRQSIMDIESSGGDYSIRGPAVRSGRYAGERAMGAYQVMPGNLPEWSRRALGREVSEEEFMSSPEIQDAIFYDQMVSNYRRHGSWEDAASVWFSGQPVARAGNASDGYTTVPVYVQRFRDGFRRYGGA